MVCTKDAMWALMDSLPSLLKSFGGQAQGCYEATFSMDLRTETPDPAGLSL